MQFSRFTQRAGQVVGAMLVAAGILAGVGARGAAADTFGTPQMLSVTPLSASELQVSFRDNSDSEIEFDVKYHRAQDAATPYTGHWVDWVPAKGGRGGIVTHTIDRLQISTEYCVSVQAWKSDGGLVRSGISNQICALTAYPLPAPTPAPRPTPRPVVIADQVSDRVCFTCEILAASAVATPPVATPAPRVTDWILADDLCYVCALTARPAAPTEFAARVTAGKTFLSWDDNASSETRYELRISLVGQNRTTLRTLPADATDYTVNVGPDMGGTVRYELKACNDNGCSAAATLTVQQ